MRVISSPSHYGPFGLQMGHLEDAFTLHPTVILQGPQAVCVNMIGVCVCACLLGGDSATSYPTTGMHLSIPASRQTQNMLIKYHKSHVHTFSVLNLL